MDCAPDAHQPHSLSPIHPLPRHCLLPPLQGIHRILLASNFFRMTGSTAPESALPGGRKSVCVLDASTYAGLWIVKALLLRGYAVHAALQNYGAGDSESAVRTLREIGRDKEGLLTIMAADVLDYHSIVRAINGCSGLFFAFDQARNAVGYHEGMVEIEVQGAHNAVEACAQSPTVQKVVFTSSVAAAVWRRHPNPNSADGHDLLQIDETFWSDEYFCRKFKESFTSLPFTLFFHSIRGRRRGR